MSDYSGVDFLLYDSTTSDLVEVLRISVDWPIKCIKAYARKLDLLSGTSLASMMVISTKTEHDVELFDTPTIWLR